MCSQRMRLLQAIPDESKGGRKQYRIKTSMPDNEYIKLTATVVTISSMFSSYYDDHLINILAYIIHIIMYYYIYK